MLLSGTIKQIKTPHPPLLPTKVVNLLSVSIKPKDKKRLILDLRYVNDHLYVKDINFDDSKHFENYPRVNKFDLKSGYHHIDIFQSL